MIHKPHVDWFALSPTLALLAAAGLLLLVAVIVPRALRKPASAVVCAVGYVAAFVFAVLLADKSPHGKAIVADAMFRDRWAAVASVLIAVAKTSSPIVCTRTLVPSTYAWNCVGHQRICSSLSKSSGPRVCTMDRVALIDL